MSSFLYFQAAAVIIFSWWLGVVCWELCALAEMLSSCQVIDNWVLMVITFTQANLGQGAEG